MGTAPIDLERNIVRWPHVFAERYSAAGVWRDDATVGGILRDAARRWPDGVAVSGADGALTFAELDAGSDRLGAALLGLGLLPGDRVLFQIGNVLESVIAYYGTLKAALIPVCAIPMHGERDMLALARQARARAYIVQADFASQDLQALAARVKAGADSLDHVVVMRGAPRGGHSFEALIDSVALEPARRALEPGAPASDDIAVFQLSGGTTGTPKIIPRLHHEYVYNSRVWAEFWGWDERTVLMHPIPLIHNAGISAALQPCHLVGARFVLAPSADPDVVMGMIERERVQVMPVVPPAVLLRLLDHERRGEYDLSSLTHLIVGGQQLPAGVADRVEDDLGIPCLQMFGMAEGMFLAMRETAPEWVRKHTIGRPIAAQDEVRVLMPDSEELAPIGEIGELCCRGPYTIRGYFDAPRHNARVFTSDGFYRTGDLAREHRLAGASYYSVEGRIKDVINRGAEKINAGEIEEVILSHPDVRSVAVVGMPDPLLGERACAFATLAEGRELTLEELVAYLLEEGLAKFKLPERLEVVDSLPLANVGKVNKKALRAEIARRLEEESRLTEASA